MLHCAVDIEHFLVTVHLPSQAPSNKRFLVQIMPVPFPDDWRDCVFVISSETGCSSRMDGLCGMVLFPRSDLSSEITNVFCDKVGNYDTVTQLTHLSYNAEQGVWNLEQRATPRGQDELLATLTCKNRYPKYRDRWHLVHESFGGKGSIDVDRWTLQDYKNRSGLLLKSSGRRLSNVEEVGIRIDQCSLNDEELVTSSDHRSWNVKEVSQELTALKSIA